MTDEEILLLVSELMKELPPDVRKALEQVSITIEDRPTPAQLRRLGGRKRDCILGLYEGVSYPNQSFFASLHHPPMITLFRKNLERYARNRDNLKDEIQRTLLHEIGHHLGLSEKDLRRRGL